MEPHKFRSYNFTNENQYRRLRIFTAGNEGLAIDHRYLPNVYFNILKVPTGWRLTADMFRMYIFSLYFMLARPMVGS